MTPVDQRPAFLGQVAGLAVSGAVLLSAVSGLSGCRPATKEPTHEGSPAPLPSPTVSDTGPAHLPDRAFQVGWGKPDVPRVMKVGRPVTVRVTVKNLSDVTWPDVKMGHPAASGAGAVRLGFRWWREDPPGGMVHDYAERRTDFPAPLPPGASVVLALEVDPPAEPGRYLLQLDLVHELITWFENKGAAVLKVPVRVQR